MTSFSSLTLVPHVLPDNLSKSQLLEFPAYKVWLSSLDKSLALQQQQDDHPFRDDPYKLRKIEVQNVDFFGGGRLGFIKLKATVTNGKGESLPGSCFMRGGSVAMLIVLRSSEDHLLEGGGDHGPRNPRSGQDDHVILTVQPRIAAGSLGFVELPAGMIDDSGTFSGAAAKEIQEETGLDIAENELINLSELAISISEHDSTEGKGESHLQKGVYPSPGGCDEFIPIFLVKKTMSTHEIDELKGKLTGLRDHGEKITLQICKLKDLWKIAARDGKTLAAVALYEGLKREGKI